MAVSNCIVTTFLYEKNMIFLTDRKYVHWGIKVNLKTLMTESSHASCLQL